MVRVSVVIIFYNPGDEFLREAVASVFGQSCPDWELLLVDDGSSDGTDLVAREYAAERPDQVRYLHHPGRENRGMSATRNLGVQHAKGEYVAFLDADDVWHSSILSDQVAILDEHQDAQMVYGPVERWFSWNPASNGKDFTARPLSRCDRVVHPPELLELMLTHSHGAPLGVMCRKAAIVGVGGYVDEFRGMCEDLAFFSKLLMAYPVYVAGRCWYRYRQHEQSEVARAFREGTRDRARIRFYKWFLRYARRHNCPREIRELVWAEKRFLERKLVKAWAKRIVRRFGVAIRSGSTRAVWF